MNDSSSRRAHRSSNRGGFAEQGTPVHWSRSRQGLQSSDCSTSHESEASEIRHSRGKRTFEARCGSWHRERTLSQASHETVPFPFASQRGADADVGDLINRDHAVLVGRKSGNLAVSVIHCRSMRDGCDNWSLAPKRSKEDHSGDCGDCGGEWVSRRGRLAGRGPCGPTPALPRCRRRRCCRRRRS
jgi:hypothetical protein